MKICKEDKKVVLRVALLICVIGALIAVGYLALYFLGWTELTQEQLQNLIKNTGAIAPLIFI